MMLANSCNTLWYTLGKSEHLLGYFLQKSNLHSRNLTPPKIKSIQRSLAYLIYRPYQWGLQILTIHCDIYSARVNIFWEGFMKKFPGIPEESDLHAHDHTPPKIKISQRSLAYLMHSLLSWDLQSFTTQSDLHSAKVKYFWEKFLKINYYSCYHHDLDN